MGTSSNVTYYVPEECYEPIIAARKAFEAMDGSDIVMDLRIIKRGDVVTINERFSVIAFETVHRCPSQGYAILRTYKKKLKQEYRECDRKTIRELMEQDIDLYDPQELPTTEFVYTGDTTFEGLLKPELSFIFSAEIFMTEATYLDDESRERCIKYGHTHIEDLIEHRQQFDKIGLIALVHISSKYGFYGRVLNLLNQKVPNDLASKFAVGLRSFGHFEDLVLLGRSKATNRDSDPDRSEKRPEEQPGYGWGRRKYKDIL